MEGPEVAQVFRKIASALEKGEMVYKINITSDFVWPENCVIVVNKSEDVPGIDITFKQIELSTEKYLAMKLISDKVMPLNGDTKVCISVESDVLPVVSELSELFKN
ncbi:MAG: hypothetical protein K0R00_89 [Herbinix sp.]|jgi:hypothetical protein|nr:hypothetical protein [Herbinix sp.]